MGQDQDRKDNQYLTFKLREETYAINVARVREVLERSEPTKIPRMPQYMMGVINVRNKVLPVIDLRLKFGMEAAEQTVDTAIIVADMATQGDDLVTVGCRADAVDQVVDIAPDAIEAPPRVGMSIDTAFVQGIGKIGDRFVIILHPDRVFGENELETIESGRKVMASPT
jgi:purine-binding chemotaxis protein CheW